MVRRLAALLLASGALLSLGPALAAGTEGLHKRYVVREAPTADIALAPPELPSLDRYTSEAMAAKIGTGPRARVYTQRMVTLEALGEFVSGGSTERLTEWAARQSTNPIVIVVGAGHIRLPELAAELPASMIEQTEPGVYVLRLPLLVDQGATLVIGDEVRELRLSQEAGAFLVNDGRLFVMNTTLSGWRESHAEPSRFRKAGEFRPFVVSWGGGELYIARSRVRSLGYAASKAYGISISQYSPGRQAHLKRPHPTGWIIDSQFEDLWFGFYCYEAHNVVVARNIYRGSIIYGIDPHDRSSGLIIAHNTIIGTRKKHGLIISRAVNDSWLFDNRVFGSGLSGIVIDRSSERNVIANNLAYGNAADGITIYESSENLLWGNDCIANHKHGIRVRNSVRVRMYHNRAVANAYSGIYGHVKDLSETDRDLRLDPFEMNVSMVVVGGQLMHNRSGPVAIQRPLSLEIYDVDLLAPTGGTGIRLTGVLAEYQHRFLDLLVRRRVPVVIEPAEGGGRREI